MCAVGSNQTYIGLRARPGCSDQLYSMVGESCGWEGHFGILRTLRSVVSTFKEFRVREGVFALRNVRIQGAHATWERCA